MIDDGDLHALLSGVYADADILTTVDEVRRRARSPVRRRLPVVITVAAALTALVTGVALASPSGRPAQHQPVAAQPDPTFLAQCASDWRTSVDRDGNKPMPPLAIVGGNPARLLVYRDTHIEYACVQDMDGRSVSGSWQAPPQPQANAPVFTTGWSSSGPSFVYGTVPPGTTSVMVRLDDGHQEPATLANGLFALVDPAAEVQHVTVIARGAITSAMAPFAYGPTCAANLATVEDAAGTSGLSTPQLVFDGSAENPALKVYGSAESLAVCDATTKVQLFAYHDGTPAQSRYTYPECLFTLGYLTGAVPPGATAATVRLSTGQQVPATLRDGFYLASWPTPLRATEVQFTTPAGIQTVPIDSGGAC